jgi:hypothetical protein
MAANYPKIRLEVVELVPESVARECCVMPFAEQGELLELYCANEYLKPISAQLEHQLMFILGRPVRLTPIPREEVESLIEFYYQAAVMQGCEVQFRFRCPQVWEFLDETDREGVRHCKICAQNVYWCDSMDKIETHAAERRCVAFEVDRGFNLLGEVAFD